MSTDQRLPELFGRALELDAEGRRALVSATAAEDPALAAELERLLAAGDHDPSPIDRPAWTAEAAGESPAPARVGPYRVLGELGRGGMGRVFLAEQEGEGFRRRVALKVVEPRGANPDLERRVRAERRILAGLEHPGIARFYDAGRDPGGAWFLALEYVEGRDLMDHVRAGGFDVADRLRLFLEVVDAVAYAHSQGVVHRDLKPGNILVGADGRPRLLDFGIAKLLASDPGAAVTETRAEHRALTPAYASPEQFRGDRITPASDVFSLGVVLYELIAGARPFAPDTGSSIELERAVMSEMPRAPSLAARRQQGTTTEDFGRSGRPRSKTTGSAMSRRALDAVCLKALEKDPHSRYRTAAELAADLRAVLERAPVAAVVARRRRRALAALAAALAVVAGAFALAQAWRRPPGATGAEAWQFVDGVPIEELRRRFAATPDSLMAGAQLAVGLVNRGHPDEAATVIGRLRQLPRAEGDPLVDYAESVVATHLDEPQRALALSTRALATLTDRGHADRSGLAARVRLGRARSLSDLGQVDEAESELDAAAGDARSSGDAAILPVILNDLAVARLMRGDLEGGEARLEEALAAAREVDDRARVALILHNLGGLAVHRGRPDLAEERYLEAARLSDEVGRARLAASTRAELSRAVRDQGRPAEADALLVAAIERLRGLDHESALADALLLRAVAAVERAALAEVEPIAAEIEAGARESGNPASFAYAEWARALAAAAAGDLAAARPRFAAARRLLSDSGNLDLAGEVAVDAAAAELESGGQPEVDLAALPAADAGGSAAFAAETLRARFEAGAGRPAEARARLETLGATTDRSPSLGRRAAFLGARAALSRAEGRPGDARLDLGAAATASESAGRRLDSIGFRLRLAELDAAAGARPTAAAGSIAEEARATGLRGLEARARALLAPR